MDYAPGMTEPVPTIVYQQIVKPPSNGQAVTSLVLGIVGIVFGIWTWIPILGLFLAFIAGPASLVAIILGHLGVSQAKRVNGLGNGQALAGLTLGYITTAILVLITFAWFATFATSYASN